MRVVEATIDVRTRKPVMTKQSAPPILVSSIGFSNALHDDVRGA